MTIHVYLLAGIQNLIGGEVLQIQDLTVAQLQNNRQWSDLMNLPLVYTLLFAQRWRDAAHFSQSKHRFRSHTHEEYESFMRKLERASVPPRSRCQ